MEDSVITYGKTEIPYRIRRSDRRTTVAITVAPGEGVVLMAPSATDVKRLDRVVHTKAQWIVERLRHVREVESVPVAKEFISGETFSYLGRGYRLKVEPRVRPARTKLERGWLRVQVGRTLSAQERPQAVREALEAWYVDHAERRLPERVAHWSRQCGLEPNSVVVKHQLKRWGSCDASGNLRLNWKIVQAPVRLIDYVVVHELAHLRHQDHTKAYWALVGKIMPDYEERKRALRHLGVGVVW